MDNFGDFLPAADEWILTLTAVDVDACNEYNLINTGREVPCKQITAMKTADAHPSDLPQHDTNVRQSPVKM